MLRISFRHQGVFLASPESVRPPCRDARAESNGGHRPEIDRAPDVTGHHGQEGAKSRRDRITHSAPAQLWDLRLGDGRTRQHADPSIRQTAREPYYDCGGCGISVHEVHSGWSGQLGTDSVAATADPGALVISPAQSSARTAPDPDRQSQLLGSRSRQQ